MADVICRWRNATPKTVCDLVSALPKTEMSSNRFRDIMDKQEAFPDFFHTAYQLACQLALYCEADGQYIPRFRANITEEEARDYLCHWIRWYYAPNPYTKSLKATEKPVFLVAELTKYLSDHGNVLIGEALESIFKDKMGNLDIVINAINNYSQVIKINNKNLSFADNYKEFMNDMPNRDDKLSFFENFNNHTKPKANIASNQPLQQNSQMAILAAVRTKPFLLLAGISGTGKSRIVRKLAQATVPKDLQVAFDGKKRTIEEFKAERWTLQRPANFELIQVKPNWHNSMDVVGYLSNIPSPHYVFTPFINFIVRAMCHPEVPFFLCLDEMNLAPVEEYFAEFLSAIESRAMTDEGYMTDPIISPFKTFGEVKDLQNGGTANVGEDMKNAILEMIKEEEGVSDQRKNEVINHLIERGVTLPKNLIIVGTVNMDETTFSFSRKVLDRAMSMEMNTVDYSSFLFDTTDDDIKAIAEAYEVNSDPTGDHNRLNKLLVDRHIEAKEVVNDLGGAAEGSDARFVIDYLENINKLLDGTPFKLGYRAANEALIYLRASQEFGYMDSADAMDKFTLMKILSRIEGDESKLKLTQDDSNRLTACGVELGKLSDYPCGPTILSAMREIISKRLGETKIDPKADNSDIEDAVIEGEEVKAIEKTPRESIKKLDSMMAQLDRDHFVSYWS